jgi:hypothetical protein
MTRFFLRLFGIRDFEPCSSCENLKEQLRYERENNQHLTDTLISIVKPKVVESPPIEINQIAASSALFSRRRAALEERDRQEAMIKKSSTNLGKPDDSLRDIQKGQNVMSVSQLESELGIEEKTN